MTQRQQMDRPKRGKFISLEGIDFSGKSTYCRPISKFLMARGHNVVQTREPGGTKMAEQIASLLKQNSAEEILPHTELWLFFAARCQHLHHFILPQLKEGNWVLSDRFILSSYAYQGGGRGLDSAHIDALVEQLPCLSPDLTLILDVPFSVAKSRALNHPKDRIEKEDARFYERVREVYLRYAAAHPSDCVVIDANREVGSVVADLKKTLLRL